MIALAASWFLAELEQGNDTTNNEPDKDDGVLKRGCTFCFSEHGIFSIPGRRSINDLSCAYWDESQEAYVLSSTTINPTSQDADAEVNSPPRKSRRKDRGTLKEAIWTDDQGKTGQDTGASLQQQLRIFLCSKIAPNCANNLLKLINEVKIGENIYRASPGRASQRNHESGWNDWAYAYWPEEVIPRDAVQKTSDKRRPTKRQSRKQTKQKQMQQEKHTQQEMDDGMHPTGKLLGENALTRNGRLAPVHLLCFVAIEGLRKSFTIHNHHISKDGLYAVCHAITQLPVEPVPSSLLFSYAIKDIKKDDIADTYTDRNMLLYLIPVDRIQKPCICVPDMAGPRKGNDRTWKDCVPRRATNFLVASPEEWPAIFKKHMADKKQRVENPKVGYDDWPEDIRDMERERRQKARVLEPPTGYDSDIDDPEVTMRSIR